MARNNVRKTEYTITKARKAVERLLRKEATKDGLPKSLPQTPSLHNAFLESAARLALWLMVLEKKNDSFTYSMLLQIWLAENNIPCPAGVFKENLDSEGAGRPRSDLGYRAYCLYKPREFGWHKVAKQLVPERYKQDPDEAAKYVQDLAATYDKIDNQCGVDEYHAYGCAGELLGFNNPLLAEVLQVQRDSGK